MTEGEPCSAVSPSRSIDSAMRMASSMRVSTMSFSGTVLMTSPRTKIWPLPLPLATPRSASRASPEPSGDLVGQRVDVDLGAAARRARHDLELAGSQVEGLEDLVADLDLLDR